MTRFLTFPHSVLLAAALAALAPQSATAADLRWDGRDRVRISAPSLEILPIEGLLTSFVTDSLFVMAHGQIHRIPMGSVKQLEVYLGMRTVSGKYAPVGLAIGCVLGGAVGTAATLDRSSWGTFVNYNGLAAGAAVGALVGCVIGAGIGAQDEEHWKVIPRSRLARDLASRAVRAPRTAAGAGN